MSVISVVGLRVRNSTFSNTNGTAPSAGIDFEPNDRNDRLEDIELTDLTIYNNSGNGIDFATNALGLHPTATPLAMTSFVVKNLLIDGGRGGGLYYDSVVGSGTLVVEGAVIRNTMLAGIMLELTSASTHHTTLRDVVLEGVAANFSGKIAPDPAKHWYGGWTSTSASASPIVVGDPKYGKYSNVLPWDRLPANASATEAPIGGLSLHNVTVRDTFPRPWASFMPVGGGGAGDITGAVRVANPAGGCKHALGSERGAGGVVYIDVEVQCG